MFCYNCGNKLAENAVVCEKCGAPVVANEEVVEEVLTPPATEPDQDEEEPAYTAPQYQEVPAINTNGNAYGILGLIFSIPSFLLCLVPVLMLVPEVLAIVFSGLGIKGGASKGMAVTALVLAIIALVITLLMTAVLILGIIYGFTFGGVQVFF